LQTKFLVAGKVLKRTDSPKNLICSSTAMPNSRKRLRTGEGNGEEKPAKDNKKVLETPSKLSVLPTSPAKTPHWRGRRRNAHSSPLSGTARKAGGERSAKTGASSERRWVINGFSGGQFSPKSIFSRNEKYAGQREPQVLMGPDTSSLLQTRPSRFSVSTVVNAFALSERAKGSCESSTTSLTLAMNFG
jgi:hypothetical protein